MFSAHDSPVHRVKGFTLVELLTVIAIVGILAAILIPVAATARSSAKQSTCSSNLRQLYIGTQLFAQDNRDMLPALYDGDPWYTVLKNKYIPEPKTFFCPSAANEPAFSANYIPYGYNFNISGAINKAPSVRRNQLLYPKDLILIADSIDTGVQQYYVTRTGNQIRAGARHNGTMQLVHADGSVARAAFVDLLDDRFWLPLR